MSKKYSLRKEAHRTIDVDTNSETGMPALTPHSNAMIRKNISKLKLKHKNKCAKL